jgi:hypothetical protein
MRDVSKMKFLCSVFCKQYQSDAKFYVDEARLSGVRNLVVVYEKGGYGGDKEFTAGIPNAWTDQDVEDLILLPMKESRGAPSRVGGVSASPRQSDAGEVQVLS